MLVDARNRFAVRTAAFLMDENVTMTEAELNARLSLFPDNHVDKIVEECRTIKSLTNRTSGT